MIYENLFSLTESTYYMLLSLPNHLKTFRAPLYKLGAFSAWIAALVFRRNLDAEYSLFTMLGFLKGPTQVPKTIVDWFVLLQTNPLTGLTFLNFFDMINYFLVALIYLALFSALWRNRSVTLILAAFLGLAGVLLYFSTNKSLALFFLSQQYAAALEPQKAQWIAAGQAYYTLHINATYHGNGFYPSFLLVSLSGLLYSICMLDSLYFSKLTAWTGILAQILGISYYLFWAFAPGMVFIPLSASAPILLVWYVLLGRQLWTI